MNKDLLLLFMIVTNYILIMRNSLILHILFFFIVTNVNAQTPITFDTAYVSYFKNKQKQDKYSSVRFHFAVQQQVNPIDSSTTYTFNKYHNYTDWNETPDPYYTKWNLPGFTGPSITITKNQEYYFKNEDFEPIVLLLNAPIDSAWTMYQSNVKNTVIKAKMVKQFDSTILDINNHLKVIELAVFDTLGKVLPKTNLHNQTIIFGDQIGFVQTIDFFYCPNSDIIQFIGYQNTAGNNQFGNGYFDINTDKYQVGDEFQTHWHHASRFGVINIYEANKCVKTALVNDTFYHEIATTRWESGFNRHQDNSITPFDTLIFKKLAFKQARFTNYPFFKNAPLTYAKMTMRFDNQGTVHRFSEINYFYYRFNDSLYGSTDASMAHPEYVSYNGIQDVFFNWSVMGDVTKKELLYYKKGNQEWGIPFKYPLGIKNSRTTAQAAVYPNPASELINITVNDNYPLINQVVLIDAIGKIHSEIPVRSRSVIVNTEGLPDGLYTIISTLETGEKTMNKILIQQK